MYWLITRIFGQYCIHHMHFKNNWQSMSNRYREMSEEQTNQHSVPIDYSPQFSFLIVFADYAFLLSWQFTNQPA